MKGSGIYKIKSLSNPTRHYIGSSVCIKKRWVNHMSLLRQNKHHSPILQNHYNKYGESDLIFEIIELCLPTYLTTIENKYLTPLPYFNVNPVAMSSLGIKRTEEQKQKNREAHLGKKMTEEQRLSMIKAVTGLKRSDETKKKMSVWQKGIKRGPLADHIKIKMSESHKGTIMPDSVRKKMSESGKRGWIARKLKYQKDAIRQN